MNKLKFRLTTLIITVLLAGMAALQAVSLKNMYDERMHDFERKVVAAMQRSAYEELAIRRNSLVLAQTMQLSLDSLSGMMNIAMKQLDERLSNIPDLSELSKLSDLSELSGLSSGFNVTVLQGDSIIYNNFDSGNSNIDIQVDTISGKRTTTIRSRTEASKRTKENIVKRALQNASTIIQYNDDMAHGFNITHDVNMLPQLDVDILAARLDMNLERADITLPYRASIGNKPIKADTQIDNSLQYSIQINVDGDRQDEYTVEITNPNEAFLKDMRWLIVSAAIIVLLIAAVCFYLQYALFRQKSLARIKADFTHNITHELKTPIAVAYAANDALANFEADDDPHKRKRYLAVVGNQLSLLSSMVERILTMSIEERDDFRLSPSECDAEELFAKLREQFLLKTDKPTTITIGVSPQPLRFTADRLHLSNIIGNLVDNAIKYSGESVDIILSATLDGNQVVLNVEDNGIGIPQSSIGHIFDKFYRVPTGERHDVKGFGLGLYYVKLIVEKHGGTIAVRSRMGKGTTFTIKLPHHGR